METEPPASCRLRWKRNRPDSCRLPWETYPPSFFVACDEMSRVLQKKNKKDKSESSNTNHCLYRLRRREYLAVVVRPYLPLLDAPPPVPSFTLSSISKQGRQTACGDRWDATGVASVGRPRGATTPVEESQRFGGGGGGGGAGGRLSRMTRRTFRRAGSPGRRRRAAARQPGAYLAAVEEEEEATGGTTAAMAINCMCRGIE